jgi:hypothetical protein
MGLMAMMRLMTLLMMPMMMVQQPAPQQPAPQPAPQQAWGRDATLTAADRAKLAKQRSANHRPKTQETYKSNQNTLKVRTHGHARCHAGGQGHRVTASARA